VRIIVRFVSCLVELVHMFSCKHACMQDANVTVNNMSVAAQYQVFFFVQKNVIFSSSSSSSRFSSFSFLKKRFSSFSCSHLFQEVPRVCELKIHITLRYWASTSVFQAPKYIRVSFTGPTSPGMARARDPAQLLGVGQFNRRFLQLLLFLRVPVICARCS
jgi:hypothetical protein